MQFVKESTVSIPEKELTEFEKELIKKGYKYKGKTTEKRDNNTVVLKQFVKGKGKIWTRVE